jgi:hypothetical protein
VVFEEVIFSSNIIKTPSPQEMVHRKKRKKEEEIKKLQESPQIKGEVNILRGEKHFNIKYPF